MLAVDIYRNINSSSIGDLLTFTSYYYLGSLYPSPVLYVIKWEKIPIIAKFHHHHNQIARRAKKKNHLFPKSSIQPTPTHHDDKNHYLCHRKRRTIIVKNKFETKRNNSKQLCGYYLKFVDFQYKKNEWIYGWKILIQKTKSIDQ